MGRRENWLVQGKGGGRGGGRGEGALCASACAQAKGSEVATVWNVAFTRVTALAGLVIRERKSITGVLWPGYEWMERRTPRWGTLFLGRGGDHREPEFVESTCEGDCSRCSLKVEVETKKAKVKVEPESEVKSKVAKAKARVAETVSEVLGCSARESKKVLYSRLVCQEEQEKAELVVTLSGLLLLCKQQVGSSSVASRLYFSNKRTSAPPAPLKIQVRDSFCKN
ncbi:hypothetical protein K435DRAFT_810750 [Dendrothele bispora CBS 962.96]|uniref:Uncharacterized protein n=1 Tax=Dendrothele bispora (strain CBS 962.96) TaxID=1314807 RepID=A0A4V4HBH0_DENBC|nr:hypothetical protein K435DRAFT_810750 [Dendrothele bispora CBS 962.96]